MTLFEKKQEILRLNQNGLSTNELTELLNEYHLLSIEPFIKTPKFWTIIGRYILRLFGQSIIYTRHINYKTIADVYTMVEKFIKTQK